MRPTSNADHPNVRRLTAATIVLLVVGACSPASVGSPAPATALAPTGAATASPAAVETSAPAPSMSADAGTRTSIGHVLGGGSYPDYTIVVPDHWETGDGHFADSEGVAVGIGVWDVGRVPADPCKAVTTMRDPGPGVDDLVKALTAQVGRNATMPVDVTLAGYSGTYLEWSVPDDMVVTGDAEFVGCEAQGNGHADYVSWQGNGHGERYQQGAGQVDRLWILDVDGQRLVVDAMYMPDATQAARDEETRVVESIRFVAP